MTNIITPSKSSYRTVQPLNHSPARTGRPALGLIFASLLRADATVLLRSKSTIFNLLLPLIVLVITGFELGHSSSVEVETVASVIGTAIVFGLVSSDVMGYPLNIAHDRDGGVFQRLRITPAPTWAIMLSRLTVHLLVNIVIALLVAAIGAIMHGLSLGVGQYLMLVPTAIIAGALFLSIGQALAALLKSATAIAAVGRVVFIALVLLGVLGSTGLLGESFKTVSQWTPLGISTTLFSSALTSTEFSVSTVGPLLACLAYMAVFAFPGIRYFRWNAR